jgi:AAA+ ATPase superfamily predicted ATPase
MFGVFMPNSHFIGRKAELDRLLSLYKKGSPGLAVIKGRRRIGKSRLIGEFARLASKQTFWSFAGLAPEDGVSAQAQRDHFGRQIALTLKIPPVTFGDWSDALEHLSLHLKDGDIVLFDEISWMGSNDPSFIPKLKAWWDKQTIHLVLVLCGSVSTWIEENILNSTAFFGRVHLTISLEAFSIPESAEFLKKLGMKISHYDTYKVLSTVGGVPWYLEQFISSLTVDENIKRLAFEKNGLLVAEFDRIFHDLFHGKGTAYKKILDCLKDGSKTLSEVRQSIEFAHSGTLSRMMDQLIVAGFVAKNSLWSFKTIKPLKQSLYRISDPYLRFYFKLIEPNLVTIMDNGFDQVPISTIPGFDSHMGFQLEVLLQQNWQLLIQKLGISPVDVVRQGPYRQPKNTSMEGCQIDYLVQTKTNSLYICEFKFKRREIGSEIVTELQEKMSRLKTTKGFAKVAVLFHLGGISNSLATSSFFYRIVDISDFLDDH